MNIKKKIKLYIFYVSLHEHNTYPDICTLENKSLWYKAGVLERLIQWGPLCSGFHGDAKKEPDKVNGIGFLRKKGAADKGAKYLDYILKCKACDRKYVGEKQIWD